MDYTLPFLDLNRALLSYLFKTSNKQTNKQRKKPKENKRLIEPWEICAGQQASVTLEYTWVNCVTDTRDYITMHRTA